MKLSKQKKNYRVHKSTNEATEAILTSLNVFSDYTYCV